MQVESAAAGLTKTQLMATCHALVVLSVWQAASKQQGLELYLLFILCALKGSRRLTDSRCLVWSRPHGGRGFPADGRGRGENGMAAPLKRGSSGGIGPWLSLCGRCRALGGSRGRACAATSPSKCLPYGFAWGICICIHVQVSLSTTLW